MPFRVETFTSTKSKQWNDFVVDHPQGSVHQVAAWKTLQEHIPGRGPALGFLIQEKVKGVPLASCWCVKMQTGVRNTSWWYSARGPVFDPQNPTAVKAARFLLKKLQRDLKKDGGLFWRIDPYISTEQASPLYSALDLNIKPATQAYQPTDTLMIDLTLADEDILAQMRRTGRRNINQALKNEVVIEVITADQVSEQDWQNFWQLNQETTDRDGFRGHQRTYYEHFLKDLSDYAVLFFATYQGQRIATAISTFCGDKAIYYFGASTSDPKLREIRAPYLLQWRMMQYAKTRGCTTYDFLGIAPENEPHHAYAGITQFKTRFGGYRQTYAPGKEIVLNPWGYRLYKLGKWLKR